MRKYNERTILILTGSFGIPELYRQFSFLSIFTKRIRSVFLRIITGHCLFPVNGLAAEGEPERQYIAMLPLTDDAEDIFLYRFIPVGEEEFNLEGIEDDAEYEAVVDVFDMLLDDAEFDSMMEDDED